MKQLSSQSIAYSTRKPLRHDGSNVGKLKHISVDNHNGIACVSYSMASSSEPKILCQSTRGISSGSSTVFELAVAQRSMPGFGEPYVIQNNQLVGPSTLVVANRVENAVSIDS
jgi:hypothetical protein